MKTTYSKYQNCIEIPSLLTYNTFSIRTPERTIIDQIEFTHNRNRKCLLTRNTRIQLTEFFFQHQKPETRNPNKLLRANRHDLYVTIVQCQRNLAT